jgi:hypothetical protein
MFSSSALLGLVRRVSSFELPLDGTRALSAARANYSANLEALKVVFPRLYDQLPRELPEMEWLYARDGSLSARTPDRQWLADCSVPARLASLALKKVDLTGVVTCLLAPAHAQEIVAAFDKLAPHQGLVVVQPSERAFVIALACADFSEAIRSKRLFPIVGPAWEREFGRLYEQFPALAPPAMMVRLPLAPQWLVERITPAMDNLVQAQLGRHAVALSRAAMRTVSETARGVLAVASSRVTMFGDAGSSLLSLASRDREIDVVDTNECVNAASLAIAIAAQRIDAGVLVAADLGRADLPAVVPAGVAWVTWCTQGRIPKFDARQGPRDRLLLIHPSLQPAARAVGWPDDRISIATDPTGARPLESDALPTIFFDLPKIEVPAQINEYSSHRLLWDRIAHEIAKDPFGHRPPVLEYIRSIGRSLGIERDALPTDLVLHKLIEPLFAKSIALHLHAAGHKFWIVGSGWDAVPELASHERCPVVDAHTWDDALRHANAIFDVWPATPLHRSRFVGRPVVATWGVGGVTNVRRATMQNEAKDAPALSMALVRRIVGTN